MATYSSSDYTNNRGPSGSGLAKQVNVFFDVTVTCTAAPSTSDTINFGYVPPSGVVLGMALIASDMDTGGSPSLTIDVGDGTTADVFFAASTVGQAGTSSEALASGGIGYANSSSTDGVLVSGAAKANAATGAAGTLRLVAWGYIDNPTTS